MLRKDISDALAGALPPLKQQQRVSRQAAGSSGLQGGGVASKHSPFASSPLFSSPAALRFAPTPGARKSKGKGSKGLQPAVGDSVARVLGEKVTLPR